MLLRPRRAMGANRCPTPRTRSRMRWERRLYGMNQQAGASCPSRTPSISLTPPRASPSLTPALRHPLYPPALPPTSCDHLPSSLFPLLVGHSFIILFRCSSAVCVCVCCADTSQQPTTSYYSKVIFLPAHSLPSCAVKINQKNVSMTSLCRVLL